MTPFSLTEDQLAIQEMARAFAADTLAPHALRWDEEKHFPVEEMRAAASLGMGGIYVSEDVGGSGLSRLDAALIFEALSAGCPTVAAYISIHNMCAWMIDRYGSDEQRQRWLPQLCSMAQLSSYCLTEPGAGSDAAALKTRAIRDGDHYVVDGQKQFISGAGVSDLYVVMVRTGEAGPGGISTLVVEKGTPGLSFGANEKKMGWNAQPTRAGDLRGHCRVPCWPCGCWTRGRIRASSYAMAGLDGGRLNIAACSLGGAQGRARHRAGLRAQDRAAPSASAHLRFPGHCNSSLADMATELEVARSLPLAGGCTKLDAKGTRTRRGFCAMAKRHVATDTGHRSRR